MAFPHGKAIFLQVAGGSEQGAGNSEQEAESRKQ